jgi:pimeloyl-ACP methyl ester carboxylesterase
VASLAESLDAFRREHPLRSVSIGGVLCRYRAAGAGTRGLLLLPGAVGDGEAYFLLEPLLRHSHRLIAISYPNSPDAEAVLDALAALAEHEGVAQVDLVGGSFAGPVAQAFLRRFPARAGRVVLSATGPARLSRSEASEKWARRIGALPGDLLDDMTQGTLRVNLPSPAGGPPRSRRSEYPNEARRLTTDYRLRTIDY